MRTDITNGREQPAAWPNIIDQATQDLRGMPPPVEGHHYSLAYSTVFHLMRYGPEEIDELLYYGQSLGQAELLDMWQGPGTKQQVVDELAQAFTATGLSSQKLFIDSPKKHHELQLIVASGQAVKPYAEQAFKRLALAERVVTDGLTVISHARRVRWSMLNDHMKYKVAEMAAGGAAARLVSYNAVSAPVEMLRRHLKATNPEVSSAAELAGLPRPDVLENAAQAARLHTEEFADSELLDQLFTPTSQGSGLDYNPHILPKNPDLPGHGERKTTTERATRMICPAAHVGGLSLFDTTLDIVWAAAQQADAGRSTVS